MADATRSHPPRADLLAGRTVVVTRPAAQAQALAERIRAAGGTPVVFPVLEIRDVEDPAPLRAIIRRIGEFDLAVFVSPNAVQKAMTAIAAGGGLPAHVRAATVGQGSAAELRRAGVVDVIAPTTRSDSEALLALPELQAVAGWRIVIFRGDGGRELLGETLVARGATVEYAECYRRCRPDTDPAPIYELWARDALSGIVVTSSEGVENLFEMVGPAGHAWLAQTLLFVPHKRIAETARARGARRVLLTGPNDDGIMAGMIDWWSAGGVRQAPA
jgi:uroporphyrinogen-III synthase